MVEPQPTPEDLDNNSVTEITQALNKNPQVNTDHESEKIPATADENEQSKSIITFTPEMMSQLMAQLYFINNENNKTTN